MARLFVIEAPLKARTLEAILAKIGFDARVQATKGHLFQMPEKLDRIGIDRAFREFERKPRDLTIVQRLRQEAMIAEEVIIATDADAEGDVIAWDVAEVIRDIHPMPQRVRLKGMDADSVREAIEQGTPVRKADALAGRTRAIIDRLIGAGFSRNGIAVGRVGTALLGLVDRDHPSVFRLTLTAPAKDGGRPFSAEAEVSAPLSVEIAQRLLELDLPALSVGGKRALSSPPGSTGDVMVRAGDRLDLSPREVSDSMQTLYETGAMSYPRSGSKGISPATSAKIAEMLKKAGYKVDGAAIATKAPTEVHDAPYPIGDVRIESDLMKLGQEDAVRAMVTRDLVKSAQKHVEEIPVVAGLVPYLEGKGFSRDVATAVASMPWRREVGPNYPGKASWPEGGLFERRPDTVLLEKAVELGLGRPSTWGKHIEQFMQRGLVNDRLELTETGRAWIQASPSALLDPRVSAAIEAACEKAPAAVFEHEMREPWEVNAERIVRALPTSLKQRLEGLVAHEPPRPKVDPIEAYHLGRDFVGDIEATGPQAPAYAPPAET